MKGERVVGNLDGLLNPIGFTRKGSTWNRRSEHVVEVIDVQVSKAGDTATVNAGVLDTDAYAKLWGYEPESFVEEPACTVRARIGELIDDKDLWWELNGAQVGEEIASAVAAHALPFLKRMHSREEMVQWLTSTRIAKKKYPPSQINVAILRGLLGELAGACVLLADIQNKAIGAWRTRAGEVAARMGCVTNLSDK